MRDPHRNAEGPFSSTLGITAAQGGWASPSNPGGIRAASCLALECQERYAATLDHGLPPTVDRRQGEAPPSFTIDRRVLPRDRSRHPIPLHVMRRKPTRHRRAGVLTKLASVRSAAPCSLEPIWESRYSVKRIVFWQNAYFYYERNTTSEYHPGYSLWWERNPAMAAISHGISETIPLPLWQRYDAR